jgi:hypothetical protein
MGGERQACQQGVLAASLGRVCWQGVPFFWLAPGCQQPFQQGCRQGSWQGLLKICSVFQHRQKLPAGVLAGVFQLPFGGRQFIAS